MVASRSGQRPHLVISGKGGQIKCDENCLNYKTLGICSHTVAVAHVNNNLTNFLAWFEKTKRKPNITSLSVHGMPAGRGRKGSLPSRKRVVKEPATNRVNRLQDETIASSSSYSGYVPPSDSANNFSTGYFCDSPYSYNFMPFAYMPSAAPHSLSTYFSPSPPMAEEQSPFKLWFISGNISKCAGCNNKYSKPPTHPYDLCV